MQINPDKVIDAIATLKQAADALLNSNDDCHQGNVAAECIKSAAALQASVQIAGHRTFHTTGTTQ